MFIDEITDFSLDYAHSLTQSVTGVTFITFCLNFDKQIACYRPFLNVLADQKDYDFNKDKLSINGANVQKDNNITSR